MMIKQHSLRRKERERFLKPCADARQFVWNAISIIRPLIVFAAMMLPWLRESLSPCSMLCGTIGLASRQRGRFAAAGRERQAAARRNHGIRLARPQGKLPETRPGFEATRCCSFATSAKNSVIRR